MKRLYQGNCLDILPTLQDEFVNCVVTSPPYYGLRDYNVEGQIGLEETPEEYIAKMVNVFREIWKVLRKDGTVWLNLGDSYVSNASSQVPQTKSHIGSGFAGSNRNGNTGLKPKDLIGIPWRVALALQADGWWLRQDIIWHKPNPMPESVIDRCTKAHEYIFLLTKSPRYYYDAEAVKEPAGEKGNANSFRGGAYCNGNINNNTMGKRIVTGNSKSLSGRRNKRSVWLVSTHSYKGAHFATFPPKLIETCILAGCPKGGTVLDPFNGSGTTGAVALQFNRKYIGIELNPEYLELTKKRFCSVEPELF